MRIKILTLFYKSKSNISKAYCEIKGRENAHRDCEVIFSDMHGKRGGNIMVTRIATLGKCINVRICNYYVNRDYNRATLLRIFAIVFACSMKYAVN